MKVYKPFYSIVLFCFVVKGFGSGFCDDFCRLKSEEAVVSSESGRLRLHAALAAVFDVKKQDLSFGFSELGRLYEDEAVPVEIRVQAGVALARAAQTLQMRGGLFPEAEGIDYRGIYRELLRLSPDSPEACFAVVYLALDLFDEAESDKAKEKPGGSEDGFTLLENFLASYRGPKEYLAAIHILLADQFIIIRADHDSAARHLALALDAGVNNPRTRELIAFRLARTYDLKLGNAEDAGKNYRRFLKDFPNSYMVPVVKRYLSELGPKREK